MVKFESHQELLSAAMQMLTRRPEANVMIVVDSDAGLEVMQTHPSSVWSFGLLCAAETMLDEQYRAIIANAVRTKMEVPVGIESSPACQAHLTQQHMLPVQRSRTDDARPEA